MKTIKNWFKSLPAAVQGFAIMAGAFVIASLIVGTIVFLCTPNVHL